MTGEEHAWRGVIAVEGQETSDGRIIEPGALAWKLPVALIDTDGWSIVGRVDAVSRDGSLIRAEGILFENAPSLAGAYPTILVSEVKVRKGPRGSMVFEACDLRTVTVLRSSADVWPECRFET